MAGQSCSNDVDHSEEPVCSSGTIDDGECSISGSCAAAFTFGNLMKQNPAQRVTGFVLPGRQSKWSVCVRVCLWLILIFF